MEKMIEAAPVVRDAEGWYSHPDIPDFDEGQEEEYRAWLAAQGLEITYSSLEAEGDDHPACVRYFEQGEADISDWHPVPPAGDGWFTLTIHSSEDGAYWVWGRRVAAAA